MEDVNKIIICPLWDLRTIGTEEEKLRLAIQVDQALLDSGRVSGDEEVDDGIDVFLKAKLRVLAEPI